MTHVILLSTIVLVTAVFLTVLSGNTRYELDICVQQYYRAITSTEWENTNLREIHFVGTNKEQVDEVRSKFQNLLTNDQGRRAVEFDLGDTAYFPTVKQQLSPEVILLGKSEKVKLYIVPGSVSAVQTDLVACPLGEQLLLNDGVANELLRLCGQKINTERLEQKQKALLPTTHGCFEISVRGTDATCDTVVFAVLPRFSETNNEDYENIVKDHSFSILQKAKKSRCKKVALPVLVMEGRFAYLVLNLCEK